MLSTSLSLHSLAAKGFNIRWVSARKEAGGKIDRATSEMEVSQFLYPAEVESGRVRF